MALNSNESKYENKITTIQVVSSLKNISFLLPAFKKNLPTTGFINFDPLQSISIPTYNNDKMPDNNRSTLSSVLGLAYRKLDVFGYYKFVTAVKNINLLPNRDAVRQQNRLKFLSGFAFKGIAGAVAGIYLILIVMSYFQISSNKEKLLEFDQVQIEFDQLNIQPIWKFNGLINDEINKVPASYIFERIGDRYKHFFIDASLIKCLFALWHTYT